MGIYISGMKMPSGCGECNHLDTMGRDIKCRATSRQEREVSRMHDLDYYRPDWCPLIEVAEPHGDLADVSEVKKCLHDLPDSEDKWGAIALLEWAMEKRTVIEAEGMEE